MVVGNIPLGEETNLEDGISVKLNVGLLVKCVRMFSLTDDLLFSEFLQVSWMVSFRNSFLWCLFSVDFILVLV